MHGTSPEHTEVFIPQQGGADLHNQSFLGVFLTTSPPSVGNTAGLSPSVHGLKQQRVTSTEDTDANGQQGAQQLCGSLEALKAGTN